MINTFDTRLMCLAVAAVTLACAAPVAALKAPMVTAATGRSNARVAMVGP